MAIFPKIESDDIVQIADKFRISASKSYISKGESAITLVEIEPEAGNGFIDVTGSAPLNSKNWYLDWEYSTDGAKVISVRVTTSGAPVVLTKTISALLSADDNLFSKDSDLVAIESDILKYVPDGRASFKYVHREAQNEILEWLYTNGYMRSGNIRFTKEDVIEIQEFTFWSKYMVLRLIFEDLSNSVGDIFDAKAKEYENDEKEWRQKSVLKIDVDGSGDLGDFEGLDLVTRNFIRE